MMMMMMMMNWYNSRDYVVYQLAELKKHSVAGFYLGPAWFLCNFV